MQLISRLHYYYTLILTKSPPTTDCLVGQVLPSRKFFVYLIFKTPWLHDAISVYLCPPNSLFKPFFAHIHNISSSWPPCWHFASPSTNQNFCLPYPNHICAIAILPYFFVANVNFIAYEVLKPLTKCSHLTAYFIWGTSTLHLSPKLVFVPSSYAAHNYLLLQNN